MQFTIATIVAISAFLPSISAHLTMGTPPQWHVPEKIGATVETSDGPQSPLQADGSNYPCHGVAPEAPVATYAPGSVQPLQLIGSAVHGGGSGQMAITYDTTPTKNSVFRTMTSWEGNHPVQADGNLTPDPAHVLPLLHFTVPAGLPAGKAVVAWVWWNRIGNREMYMQCATVEISGSETSSAAFDSLPTMFRANSGNGCTVPEGVQAIKFKNPGPEVIGTGSTTIDCDSTTPGTGTGTGTGSGSSPVSSPVPVASSPVATASSPAATASSPATYATSTQVLVKVPTATGSPAATATPNSTSFYAPIVPSSTATPSSGSGSGSGSCVEGTVTCSADGKTWSLCGSGTNQNMGAVAPGMQCVNGQMTAASKRSVRFSHEHRRRHHN